MTYWLGGTGRRIRKKSRPPEGQQTQNSDTLQAKWQTAEEWRTRGPASSAAGQHPPTTISDTAIPVQPFGRAHSSQDTDENTVESRPTGEASRDDQPVYSSGSGNKNGSRGSVPALAAPQYTHQPATPELLRTAQVNTGRTQTARRRSARASSLAASAPMSTTTMILLPISAQPR